MTARRAILDPDIESGDPIAPAFAKPTPRRGIVEEPLVIEDSPVSVATARRAVSAPISFEPDDVLGSTRELPKISNSASSKATVRGRRLRRGLFGAAAAATASAILIIPNAVSTVTAQDALPTDKPVSRSMDREEVAINPVAVANERAAAEAEEERIAEEARQAEEARLAEEEAARVAEEERIAAEQAAAAEKEKAATGQGSSNTSTPSATPSQSAPATGGGSCGFDGSGLGLTANAYSTFQAVCAQFPGVTSYGGWRPSGDDHGQGRAIDIMISGPAGWDIANWLVANSGSLNVEYVIYEQQIWGSWQPGAGFTMMEDRGSITQNHYDHVHVTIR